MTNKELIETAKEAMKDLWEINQGRLLEHEQTIYNCLRLFCERLPVDEPTGISEKERKDLLKALYPKDNSRRFSP